MTALRRSPILLALLLVVPAAWGASITDPIGDEAVYTNPAVASPPPGTNPCHDPRVDITNVEVTSVGVNATVRLEVFDVHGAPSCDATHRVGIRGDWRVLLGTDTGGGLVPYAQALPNGSLRLSYLVNGTDATTTPPPSNSTQTLPFFEGSLQGNVFTWTIPLAATWPTTYDYRGLTLNARGLTHEFVDSPSTLQFLDQTPGFDVTV